MTQADRIRQFILERHVNPARSRGGDQVTVRAGDVHREMGLTSAMPAVCSAIGSSKFADLAHVTMTGRSGPKNGSTVVFTFALTDASAEVRAPKPGHQLTAAPVLRPDAGAPAPLASSFNLSRALVLLSCVKSKRTTASPARELYTSPLFSKMRAIVEAQGAEWRILSALHGLVDPQEVIKPYEYTLNGKGVRERRAWAEGILPELLPLATKFGRVVFFAGERYREFLQEPLLRQGVEVDVPMRGLSFGQQLAWLSHR